MAQGLWKQSAEVPSWSLGRTQGKKYIRLDEFRQDKALGGVIKDAKVRGIPSRGGEGG